jgi:Tol biopolymer transport system component
MRQWIRSHPTHSWGDPLTKRRPDRLLAVSVGLLSVLAVAAAPASAKPRSRIVWSRFERGTANSARLVSARPNGRDLRSLTFPGSHTQDVNAAISPNGRQIAFERDLNDGDSSKIVLKGARSDHRRVPDLGCTDPCAFLDAPTWLNSGQRIAYTPVIGPFDQVNHSARSAVLHSARTDGSDVRRLSQPGIDGKFEEYHARFSPDRSYVVFDRVRNADVHEALFRMAADGSNVRRLTPWKLDAADEDLSLARTGPTKDRIVFQTYGQGPPRRKSQNIATVPATCAPASECRAKIHYVTHHSGGEVQSFTPSWSPHGRRIAYVRFKTGDRHHPFVGDIWTSRPDGSARRPVSTSPLFDYSPDWGPVPRG